MSLSSLIITSGAIPQRDPFSCCLSEGYIPRSLWCWPPADLASGDLWIDYPFPEPFPELDRNKSDPPLALDVKTRLDRCINDLVNEGERRGVGAFASELALRELLTNATQYGRVGDTTHSCMLVRLEWEFHQAAIGGGVSIAVSNPCPQLFDPTQFSRMPLKELLEISGEGSNGHVGTTILLGFSKENSSLYYVWHLHNGERIRLQVQALQPDLQDASTKESKRRPMQLTVSRLDAEGRTIPYSLNQFENDAASGLPTDKVTVACTVS